MMMAMMMTMIMMMTTIRLMIIMKMMQMLMIVKTVIVVLSNKNDNIWYKTHLKKALPPKIVSSDQWRAWERYF